MDLAQKISPEDVQLYYQIGLIGRRDLPLAPDSRGGFEMVLLRMLAFRPTDAIQSRAPATPAAANKTRAPISASSAPAAAIKTTTSEPVAVANVGSNDWEGIVNALQLSGMAHQLAINCAIAKRDGEVFQLTTAPAHKHLLGKSRESALAKALSQYLGHPVKLSITINEQPGMTPANLQQTRDEIRQDHARMAIEDDSAVQAFKDVFGAQVNPDSVQPVD